MHRITVLANHLRELSSQGAQRPSADAAVVIGGTVLDVQATPTGEHDVVSGGSVPGTIQQAYGGVGRNIAHCLSMLARSKPLFITVVGSDPAAEAIVSQWQSLGLSIKGFKVLEGQATPAVSAIFNLAGDVAAEVACVDALEQHLGAAELQLHHASISAAQLLILDGNLSSEAIKAASRMARRRGCTIWFEPVSAAKAVRALDVLTLLDFISPNAAELLAVAAAFAHHQGQASAWLSAASLENALDAEQLIAQLAPALSIVLQAGVQHMVLTLGARGAALCRLSACRQHICVQHMPALPARIANLSGAGDCLVAGAAACLLQGGTPVVALAYGMATARSAVESHQNVPPCLDAAFLQKQAGLALDTMTSWHLPAHQCATHGRAASSRAADMQAGA